MPLKIRDIHLTCKVANKFLSVRERVEVVEWNKTWSPPFSCCPVNLQCLWKKTLTEKENNLGFQGTIIIKIPMWTLERFQCSKLPGNDDGKVEVICGLRKYSRCLTDWSYWLFSCLFHELIIEKLNAYGFSLPALKLMHNYSVEQKRRTKIN